MWYTQYMLQEQLPDDTIMVSVFVFLLDNYYGAFCFSLRTFLLLKSNATSCWWDGYVSTNYAAQITTNHVQRGVTCITDFHKVQHLTPPYISTACAY